MTEIVKDEVEHIRQVACQLLATTNRYHHLTLVHLSSLTGKTVWWLQNNVFPPPQWPTMRDAWATQRLQQAMDDLYQKATTQEDFSARQIARTAGIPTSTFWRLMRHEWQRRLETLPTPRERVTSLVWQFVDTNPPLEQFTRKRIAAFAGIREHGIDFWFSQLYRAAYLTLRQHQEDLQRVPPPAINGRLITGTWIDLDSDSWDLRSAGLRVLKRDNLRNDIAEVAWPLLREELRTGELAPSTIATHYETFFVAGKLLGEHVPDIHLATLEDVQRAWAAYTGTLVLRRRARMGLRHVFGALLAAIESTQEMKRNDLYRITGWLQDFISFPHDEPASDFLSEEEMNTMLAYCITDIQAGMEYMSTSPDLRLLSGRDRPQKQEESARLVIYWAVALMILVMSCTGLRRQSILLLEVGDWMELRPGMFGVIWHHWKKGEEHLAVLSPIIAQHLQQYVDVTAVLRTALQTKSVFLNGNPQGLWEQMKPASFENRLREFAIRHQIERNGLPIHLGSTIFRRTFTTRSLYEGRSLEALRSQLGHTTVMSTLLYSKLDMFEHPGQVRAPLDLYGRHALTLWKTPLLLDELSPEERVRLLNQQVAQHQEVGICRHDYCVQLDQGSPPPCSLCEHLVTGKIFLPIWHRELQEREQTLEELKESPGAEVLYAQLKGQRDQFKRNLTFIETNDEEREVWQK